MEELNKVKGSEETLKSKYQHIERSYLRKSKEKPRPKRRPLRSFEDSDSSTKTEDMILEIQEVEK